MHAAVAQQSRKMKLSGPPALHRLPKQRHVLQLLIGDQQVDPRNVHVHDPPRTHVHVPHFAVAHLSLGQSDKWPGRMNQCVGKCVNQFVIRRLACQRDRVPLGLRSVSPSIQHGQYNRLRSLGHSHLKYTIQEPLLLFTAFPSSDFFSCEMGKSSRSSTSTKSPEYSFSELGLYRTTACRPSR